ncbi:MAG: bifunctional phosphoribosylaminoimidazolecarboxamide formyltransferase/IMP cyclohydrolase, partial [Leptospiraceae bacterium]|nr:bifunctional phosphoribosylaminoimidazolecarboxamide formyltransferase/IMP cyclohydrolase [Leptospiraceae bacterium]
MIEIKRALLSVSDKTGLAEFARFLHEKGVEIVSTGGTLKTIEAANIPVRPVDSLTGFPEMMDGRLKTLHPKVHGGLLALRNNPSHKKSMEEHGIQGIDLLVVNLYPFAATVASGKDFATCIENIDIGG